MELDISLLIFFMKSMSGISKMLATFISLEIANVFIIVRFPNIVSFLFFQESN